MGDCFYFLGKIEHDFTLFEFFQSDIAGHRRDFRRSRELIERLDRFIGKTVSCLPLEEVVVLVVSDHGNMEDLSVSTHTVNPVPTIIIHDGKLYLEVKTLEDITPLVLRYLNKS